MPEIEITRNAAAYRIGDVGRRILTPALLDALQPARAIAEHWEACGCPPEAAIVRDSSGRAFSRDVDNAQLELSGHLHAGWWMTGSADEIDSTELNFPITVLWSPEVSTDGE